jgi:hypothetical protein
MPNSKNTESIFIFLEIVFGLAGGIFYIYLVEKPRQSLFDSILTTYLVLNGIFFGVTVLFGVMCGLLLNRTRKLLSATLMSLAIGVGFLLLHAFALPIPFFAFFSLFGYIIGFHLHPLCKNTA